MRYVAAIDIVTFFLNWFTFLPALLTTYVYPHKNDELKTHLSSELNSKN